MAWYWPVKVPHGDYWIMVANPYLRWMEGGDFWSALHEQVSHSRFDSAKLIQFLLVRLTHMDMRAEPLASVALSVLSAAAMISMFNRAEPGGRRVAFLLATLLALLWLSPDRSMNWTYAVLVCWDLAVAALLFVVVVLQTRWPLWLRMLLAGVGGVVAVHSLIVGWFVWGVSFAWLLWEGCQSRFRTRSFLTSATIWVLMAGLCALLFFPGYKSLGGAPPGSALQDKLVEVARYVVSLLGSPFAKPLPGMSRAAGSEFIKMAAPWLGGASVLLFFALLWHGIIRGAWRRKVPAVLPFLLLILWSLASTMVIAIARAGVAVSNFAESRYLTITLIFHAGLLGILFTAQGTAWTWLRRGWLIIVIVGYVTGFMHGLQHGHRDHLGGRVVSAAVALRHAAPEPIFLDAIEYGMGLSVLDHLDSLDKKGMLHVPSIRSERVVDAPLSSTPAVGAIRTFRLDAGRPALTAWAVDTGKRDAVDALVVSYQQENGPELWLGIAQRRIMNPRMSHKYGVRVIEDRVGWSYVYGEGTEYGAMSDGPNAFPLKALPSGRITFRAYAFDTASGTFSRLEGEAAIDVPPGKS